MLRVTQPQLSLWDAVIPPHLVQLNDELAKVDQLLDDADVLAPFIKRFSCRMGRPTVPVDTFLRLMYLKFRYQLGYETLVGEVNDSLMWRRFCRIPLDEKVPDATTLIKLRKKYGAVVDEVNRLVIDRARERRVVRGKKLRVDTTVVPSDIHYPTDAGQLADGVRLITRVARRIQQAGIAASAVFRDRSRSIKKRILAITKVVKRRTGEAWNDVRAITGEIIEIAKESVSDAHRVLATTREKLRRTPERVTEQILNQAKRLNHYVTLTEQIIKQAERVQQGERSIPGRIVSLFDPKARPIRKGKLNAPTEFGRKVMIQETEERVITHYRVLDGNPPDTGLLISAVDQHTQMFHEPPQEVAADRGFFSAEGEKALYERGVHRVSIPKPGRLSPSRREQQRQHWFRRLQRFRAGGEATISLYKRKFGGSRSRFRDPGGTEAWVGWGIMAYNLRRLAQLS